MQAIAVALKVVDTSLSLSYSTSGVNKKEVDFSSRHMQKNGTLFANYKLANDFNLAFSTKQRYILVTIYSISGVSNKEVDFASRRMWKDGTIFANYKLTNDFNLAFSTKQRYI